MRDRFRVGCGLMLAVSVCLVSCSVGWAVGSKITRQATSADLLKGETEDVVIGSRGTIALGRMWEALVEDFGDVWSVNSIVVSGEIVYVGTSPNGGIYKYSQGKLVQLYPVQSSQGESEKNSQEPNDVNKPPDANKVQPEEYLLNEHIFAMATDVAGRLVAGISGKHCKLLRFEEDKPETIFEPNDAKYIFAIALDQGGHIYLGTGPQGKLYQLDPQGNNPRVIYQSRDKNILSLAAPRDGFVYAGSDSRGLVYKIDPRNKTATVLYDSDEPEIAALLFTEDGDLHAAATSAEVVQTQAKFAAELPSAGRPELPSPEPMSAGDSEGGMKLKIPNTATADDSKAVKKPMPVPKGAKPGKASHLYKIDKEGFVTDVFSQAAVFFCLDQQDKKLLVGTGNNAQLFTVDPANEDEAIVYEDEQASQITAVAVSGQDVYLGTANPAKLVKLGAGFAAEGTYTSDLIDADQPANWGKLQIEADVPNGCKVLVASRSGNVKDANDPTFSPWTEPAEMTGPVQLLCPLGRFCQYKLLLQSDRGAKSPVIREVAVASTVPNLAPKVESVSVDRITAPGKTGVFKIGYKAEDDNKDKLIYRIDFRKVGRKGWIELKDEHEADNFEWDGKTVEDGRYEVRITASDERSNTTTTKLAGSRISDPLIIDNTGPVIKEHAVRQQENKITLNLKVSDELSAIEDLSYTVDSNAEWIGALPEDSVFDTTDESFAIVIEDLEAGEHIIAVRIRDAVGNTTYKTFEVAVAKKNS